MVSGSSLVDQEQVADDWLFEEQKESSPLVYLTLGPPSIALHFQWDCLQRNLSCTRPFLLTSATFSNVLFLSLILLQKKLAAIRDTVTDCVLK